MNKNKKVYSFYDSRGMLHVDCTECERGHYGKDPDKCSAGSRYKKHGMGCFIGSVIDSVDLEKAERL